MVAFVAPLVAAWLLGGSDSTELVAYVGFAAPTACAAWVTWPLAWHRALPVKQMVAWGCGLGLLASTSTLLPLLWAGFGPGTRPGAPEVAGVLAATYAFCILTGTGWSILFARRMADLRRTAA
jgi:hypothetical protein